VPTSALDQVDAQMSAFKSKRSAAKLPPAEHFCRMLEVGCAADDDTAIRQSTPFLMEKYKSYFSWGLEGLTLDPNATPEQQFAALASKRFAVGAPASVIDMLVAQHHCGINHLSMRVSWPGMGQDEILASIELLGRKVLPEVRRRIVQSLPDHQVK
jgi:alkanesulfonate monooxygenase SsuD/methylene tetrahydromethanopterin reductase-like flavin-dependent oxidoreductase (luciferase family)